ncbi:MAG: DUF2934 domain-containing protein [Verrucomicrobia bacterium]|nr:DUF2934 domain-containing protein [Verrucomicrobiota bacterium]
MTQEQIAKRAYEIWLSRGCQHGNAESDWLQAETELKKELQSAAPVVPSKLAEVVTQTLAKRKVAAAKTAKSTRNRVAGLKAA